MSRSKLALLGLGGVDGNPSLPATQSLLFTSFDPGHRQETIDIGSNMGGFGSLAHPIGLTRLNSIVVTPRMQLKPSSVEWNALLRWIFNTNPAGLGPFTFTFGTASTPRVVDYSDTVLYHHLTGVVVSRATISAQSRGEVILDIEGVGSTWTNSGTFPTLSPSLGSRLLFGDLGLSVTGIVGSVPCRSIRITIDHMISADRYYFGFTQTPLNLDRVVTMELEIPFAIASAMWSIAQVDGGVPVSATFSGGYTGVAPTSLTFSTPSFRAPQAPAPAEVPNELFCRISGQCFAGVTTNDLIALFTP